MSSNETKILAVGAHPDDVELNVGGLLLLERARGGRTTICHFTDGEMGTRGDRDTRLSEARLAAAKLGAAEVVHLGLADGRVTCDEAAKDAFIRVLRAHRPRLVLAPYWEDLHPDHQATGQIVKQAAFLSGLTRWDTGQSPWRPDRVLYYMSHTRVEADLIVDISEVFAAKKEAALSYRSQFHDADSVAPETFISRPDFWSWWEGRAAWWGHFVGVRYGEGYFADGPIPTRDPGSLFTGFGKYRNS